MNERFEENDVEAKQLAQLKKQDGFTDWWCERLRLAAEVRKDAATIAVLRRYEVLVNPLFWDALFGPEPPTESDGEFYESPVDVVGRLIQNWASRRLGRRHSDDEDK
jgi:hypothetical protein